MKISPSMSDDAITGELGHRLMAERLERNLTQAALAEQAGVALQTVARLETGTASIRITGLIRILRALGLTDRLDQFLPEKGPSPLELVKLHGKRRRRASRVAVSSDPARTTNPWTWAE
jgi:transcriptional regulator with XRE-family HTH domain